MTPDQGAACPSTMEIERFIAGESDDAQIGSHLDSCDRCQGVAEDVRANNTLLGELMKSQVGPDGEPSPFAALAGREQLPAIEGYEIAREMHRGGQGVVYRAIQLATNRTVALKVLLAGAFATSRQRRRFEREIELVAGLEHSNIVTVYDSGQTRDGSHFLAMHYVQGVPLDEWMREQLADGPPPVRAVLRLFVRICDGVSHAHLHGIIHRDLKPANILVEANGEPRILDFGLAKPIDEAAHADQASVTREGAFLGTLAYAAPEQTRGEPGLIDVRTDVYALGVVFYELLTGQYPYRVEGELADVLHAIVEEDPIPLTKRRGDSGGRGGPGYKVGHELETIVLKALSKDPARRYQSAAALRDDIERLLNGEPIEAKRDSGLYVLRKTLQRYRLPTTIAACFIALLIVFTAVVLVKNHRIQMEAAKVRQINIFLEDTLGSVQPGRPGHDVAVRELLDEAVQWIDIALSDQEEVAASIQTTVGNSYRNIGMLDEAEEQLEAALRTRKKLFGEEHIDVARSMNHIALVWRARGQLEEAERLLREAMAMQSRLSSDEKINVYTLVSLAAIRRDLGDLDGAHALITQSRAIRRRVYGNENPEVAMCDFLLAEIAADRGDLAGAIAGHRGALQMRREVLHRKHSDFARSLYALGSLLLETGEIDEAEQLFRECLEVRSRSMRPGHWLIAEARSALGAALTAQGKFVEAESALLESCQTLGVEDGATDETARVALDRVIELYEVWGKTSAAAIYRELNEDTPR